MYLALYVDPQHLSPISGFHLGLMTRKHLVWCTGIRCGSQKILCARHPL